MAIRLIVPPSAFAAFFVIAGCGDTGAVSGNLPSDTNEPCLHSDGSDCNENGGDDDNETARDSLTEPQYWIIEGERSAEAAKKPWSSWWYPIWQDTLFKGESGELSTLEKYDAFALEFAQRRTTAATYERTNIYDPRAASWAGLCDAWAIASILEREPTHSIRRGQLTFQVGDLKALLLKTYEKISTLSIVGARFNGEWNDEYADVNPRDLHRVIEEELIGKRRPFIIDEDAGPEVWNEPAWKVITKVERVAGKPRIARVRTYLFLASPHVEDRHFVGTQEDSREYTYDLEGEWKGNLFGVVSGKWTDRSQWDHPDYAIVLPERVKRGSFNPQIDPAIVDRILGH